MRHMYMAVISLLLVAPPVLGQEGGSLSLEDALQIAYQHNPRVAQARQDAEAAKGRWMQTRTLPNPELEVSATELSQAVRGGSTVGEDSIAVSQKLDVLGAWQRGRAGKAEYQAAQHDAQRVWSEVVFEVTATYNNLLRARQQVDVAREALRLSRGLLDDVQLRHQAGDALRNELLRAQIEAAKAENAVLESEKRRGTEAGLLNILLGRDAQTPVTPADDLTYEPRDLDLERLLAQALARRPDLHANEALVKAKKERWRLALSEIIESPTVTAIGTREQGEAGEEQVFGLAVSWPLPLWNQNRGAIREARAELAKQTTEQEALKRQIGLEVTSTEAEVRLAQRQLSVWHTAVDQASELIQVASLQYREGEINLITYLEHLATASETKAAYVEALANYRTQLALLDQIVATTLEERP